MKNPNDPLDWNEALDYLGHSSELKELDEHGIGEIIQRIADNSKIADQFEDIIILHSNQSNFLGCVDVRNGTLYINANTSVLTPSELIRSVNGLMNHESLHINRWLGIPGTSERAHKHNKVVKKMKGCKDTLNWLYDLEGHYQSSTGFLNPIQELELREFITLTRQKIEEKDPENPVLSMETPKTKLQKEIQKIVLDRSITLLEKVKLLSKLLKDYKPPQLPGSGEGEGDKVPSEGSPNDSDSPSKDDKTEEKDDQIVITKIIGDDPEDREWLENQLKKNNSESIKEEIDEEKEYRELQKRIQRHGIKAGTAKDVINYYKDNGNPLQNIKALDRCLKDMLGFDSGFLKKLKETSPKIGHRMNGYRKARDIQEMSQSIESLVTDGLVDINDVRVPDLIHRKRKGIMIILRDVSGSVLHRPVDRVVRDATMFLISQAKKEKHRLAVIDFECEAHPIPDENGNVLTDSHQNILLKSVHLKGGGGTNLESAIEELNRLIEKHNLKDTPINVYVITDSFISALPFYGDTIEANKFTLTGIVYNTNNQHVSYRFKNFIDSNGGKLFFIELSVDRKLINGLKSISPGSGS